MHQFHLIKVSLGNHILEPEKTIAQIMLLSPLKLNAVEFILKTSRLCIASTNRAIKHQLTEDKYAVSNIASIIVTIYKILRFTWRHRGQQGYLVLISYLTSLKHKNFVTVDYSVQPMGNSEHSA